MNSRIVVSILLLIIISGGIGYIYGKSSNKGIFLKQEKF